MLSEEEILDITGGFKDWRIRPTGGGFQGSHFYLESGGKRWFVKMQPDHPVSDYYHRLGVFVKEPKVYSTLLPELRNFSQPGLKIWPDVHLARNGAMVLEDLTESGWRLAERLDEEHINVVLETLAAFHAASIKLDLEKPLLETYPDIVRETYLGESPKHPGLQTWLSFNNTARKIYSIYFPRVNPENPLRLMENAKEMVKPSLRHRNCVCHGDLWQNNIFFKYLNGHPVEACFVDFAQVRYCPPAMDLLMFLRYLQVENLDQFINHYHSSLQKHIPDFALDELTDSFEVALPFALCIAPLYVFLTRLPEKALREVTRSQEDFWEFATGKDGPALEAMKDDVQYRSALLRAFKELLDFTENSRFTLTDNI